MDNLHKPISSAEIDLAHEPDFSVGALRVLPSLREIRGARGAVTVEPRVMQALVSLVRAQGAVVSRDDLIRSCWGGRAVGEDAINRCIAKVRQLAENDEFAVETVPRVGYRLVPGEGTQKEAPASSRLSICVMPFANLSDDPQQEFLADGLALDIITDLSRWPSLAVLSRHASARFKGETPDPRRIGRELGVRYVVDGSIRRMGDRIRVSANLTDADSGNHVWAERYDRPIADFFAVQDHLVRTIVGTLVGRVFVSEGDRLGRKPPSSLAAYELTLRGNAMSWDDPATAAEARECFETAIKLDPAYGFPHSLLATMLKARWERDLEAPDDLLDRAFALARKGVALADNQSTSHAILGTIYLCRRAFDMAVYHLDRAIEINPSNHWNIADYGEALLHLGRAEEGLKRLREARRSDPYYGPPWYWRTLGRAQFVLHRYAEALSDFERGAGHAPSVTLAMMAGCWAKLGDQARAGELMARCFARFPNASIDSILRRVPFRIEEDTEHLRDCLRLAGGLLHT